MGKLLFFPFQDGEISSTSNIYSPYLVCSNRGLGCDAISHKMLNIEQCQLEEIGIIKWNDSFQIKTLNVLGEMRAYHVLAGLQNLVILRDLPILLIAV